MTGPSPASEASPLSSDELRLLAQREKNAQDKRVRPDWAGRRTVHSRAPRPACESCRGGAHADCTDETCWCCGGVPGWRRRSASPLGGQKGHDQA